MKNLSRIQNTLLPAQHLPAVRYGRAISNKTSDRTHHLTASGSSRQQQTSASERERVQVFVRQPFTESGNTEKDIIQGVLDVLASLDVNVVTGTEAQSQDTFRTSFENTTGLPFTPVNFRAVRLGLLQAADAMVFIRTSLSESGAFEAAYNVYAGPQVPMFFAVWKHAPIKTTLLRDLDEFCTTEYVTFETPEELRLSLISFMLRAAQERNASLDRNTPVPEVLLAHPGSTPIRKLAMPC